jgi:hypothetical protein
MGLKKRIGRPPNREAPRSPALWESPAIDKQVDEILTSLDVPKIDAETRGIFQRMIHRQKYFGGDAKGRIIFIIRTITESNGNEGALIGPIVSAVSSCMEPRWVDLGLAWIEFFDSVGLEELLERIRALDFCDGSDLEGHLRAAIWRRLVRHFGPPKIAAPKKPPARPKMARPPGVSEQSWNDVVALRKKRPKAARMAA